MWKRVVGSARKCNDHRQSLWCKCGLLQAKAPRVSRVIRIIHVLLSFLSVSLTGVNESWWYQLPQWLIFFARLQALSLRYQFNITFSILGQYFQLLAIIPFCSVAFTKRFHPQHCHFFLGLGKKEVHYRQYISCSETFPAEHPIGYGWHLIKYTHSSSVATQGQYKHINCNNNLKKKKTFHNASEFHKAFYIVTFKQRYVT